MTGSRPPDPRQAAHAPYTLVCDPGIDDLVALLVLCGAGSPPSAVVATAGNTGLAASVRNAAGLHALLELDRLAVPLIEGTGSSLAGPYPGQGLDIHGADGVGGTAGRLPGPRVAAAPFAPEALRGRLLVTSPLTPVAHALRAGHRPEVTWMGGAWEADGNATPVAEFNAWLDAEAADEVLRSPPTSVVVPLDVTDRVTWSSTDLDAFAALGGPGLLTARACRRLVLDGPTSLPDVVAATAFLWPGLFRWRSLAASCVTAHGALRGMTECVPSGRPTASVAVDVNAAGVRRAVSACLATLAATVPEV
ncbi:nucleoside hydrolase [Streptomyces triticirhizae]|uniref:nucleoside hydrolase n=1 Tax=Streptomyces triticirhizae TaxID=2483353 RepID=UPI0013150D7D|nr:nucleoside hydrolase [Streptomyces triticirhizae]